MNSSQPALNQCPAACSPGEPCCPTQAESSKANPNRAALLGHGDGAAPDSLTDFMVTGAVESATTRAQTDLTNRFQTLCANGDGYTVGILLSRMSEAEINQWLDTPLHFSQFNDTPMMYVARHNLVSIASLLLSHNANPVKPNPYSETKSHPLFIAAQRNQVEVIHLMSKAKGFDPNTPRSDGHNALSVAVLKENRDAVKALLECKANPNYQIAAVFFNGKLQPVKCLSENEAACAEKSWITMINVAARKGNAEILRLLLANNGNPNNVDPGNPLQQSPLVAAFLGNAHEEIIRLLLAHGADMHEHLSVSPPDWSGITQDKINKRATICQFACAAMQYPENEPILKLLHRYYRTKEGKSVSFKKFYEENSSEGFCRLIATSDGFFKPIFAVCGIDNFLPYIELFLQNKMTEIQINDSDLDENQAKILKNLTEEKTQESLSQLKKVTLKELQELFLLYLGKLKNDGITMTQDADKHRASLDEFSQGLPL